MGLYPSHFRRALSALGPLGTESGMWCWASSPHVIVRLAWTNAGFSFCSSACLQPNWLQGTGAGLAFLGAGMSGRGAPGHSQGSIAAPLVGNGLQLYPETWGGSGWNRWPSQGSHGAPQGAAHWGHVDHRPMMKLACSSSSSSSDPEASSELLHGAAWDGLDPSCFFCSSFFFFANNFFSFNF